MTGTGDDPSSTLRVAGVALTLLEAPPNSFALHALFVRSAGRHDAWSLPSSPVSLDESLDDAARRVIGQTGVSTRYVEQLEASTSDRDEPRVVTVAYHAFVNQPERFTSDAVGWFPVGVLPQLSPLHHRWVHRAIARIRDTIRRAPMGFAAAIGSRRIERGRDRDIGKIISSGDSGMPLSRDSGGVFDLLPSRFSLTHLQRIFEAIEGVTFDKRNFRKKVLATGLLIETDEVEQGVRHRAAKLYRIDRRRYDRLAKQ